MYLYKITTKDGDIHYITSDQDVEHIQRLAPRKLGKHIESVDYVAVLTVF